MSDAPSHRLTVGVPTEIKAQEHRVGITAAGVRELVDAGHQVLIERGAGSGAGISDHEYSAQGATVVADAILVYGDADVIVKVKEPQPEELKMLRAGQILFTYLHLAADRELTEGLMRSGATCVAYETVRDATGGLPLLAPMSQVAGRLAAQAAADALRRTSGGAGVLVGGIPGVPPATMVVVGAGAVGANAAAVAIGMGAQVHVLDRNPTRLRELAAQFAGRIVSHHATTLALEQLLPVADAVIGAVLVTGARAPRVLHRDQLGRMRPGSVLVDVSIDQGGCFETSRATTHTDPLYEVDGVQHYCVANMPAAVPVTATQGLTNATLPYVLRLADRGVAALGDDPGLASGLAVCDRALVSRPVAETFGLPASDPPVLATC